MRNSEPDANSVGNALGDPYVRSRRRAWSVDTGSAGDGRSFGGFMDSDRTVAYEGGGYSFSVAIIPTSSGSLMPRPTPGRRLRRFRI